MKWSDVAKVHRKISSIYSKNGEIKSFLFSRDYRRSRTNQEIGDKLILFVSPSTVKQYIEAIKITQTGQKPVKVYYKLSPDSWMNKGDYTIIKVKNGKDTEGRESCIIELFSKDSI